MYNASGVTFETIWTLLLAIANHPSTRALVQHLARRVGATISEHIAKRRGQSSTAAAERKAESAQYRMLTDDELMTAGSRSMFGLSGLNATDQARFYNIYHTRTGSMHRNDPRKK